MSAGKTVLVALLAQAQIQKFDFWTVAGILNHFREQAEAGRILLHAAVKCRLVIKPAVAKLKSIVPGDGFSIHQQSRQHNLAGIGK